MADLARILPLVDGEAYSIYDNFAGTVAALSGRVATTGQVWSSTGAASAIVTAGGGNLSQSADTPAPGYAVIDGTAVPWEIGCTFSFSGVATAPVIACFEIDFSDDMFHFYMSPTAFNWTYWKDGLTAQAVTWGDQKGAFSLAADTVYTYRIFLEPPFAHGVLLLADGTIVSRVTIYEPNMAAVIGSTVFFETFNASLKYHTVWTKINASDQSYKNAFAAGLQGTPIGLKNPAPAILSSLHVGPGAPSSALSYRYDEVGDIPKILGSGVAPELQIKAEGGGYGALLRLINGAGAAGTVTMSGGYALEFAGNSGAAFLTKPANAGTPYFSSGVKVNGSSGVTQTDASAKPTSGSYTVGDFVWNKAPSISGGKVLLGWSRLTTGSAHVLDTDWAACYATNS